MQRANQLHARLYTHATAVETGQALLLLPPRASAKVARFVAQQLARHIGCQATDISEHKPVALYRPVNSGDQAQHC